jgi:hypothetical protein
MGSESQLAVTRITGIRAELLNNHRKKARSAMGRYARLTEAQVARICFLHDVEKLPGTVIATRTGLSIAQVRRLLDRAHTEQRTKAA